jgi:tetratricopeptide (TPR) repeat protein
MTSRRRALQMIAGVCVAGTLLATDLRAHGDSDAALQRLDAELAARPQDAELWRSRAVLLRRSRDFERAHADLDRAVGQGLDPALAHRDRGLLWMEEGRLVEAEADLRAARDLAPLALPTLLAHARVLAKLERFDAAAAAYARLVELAPRSDPDVRLERVRTIAASGSADAATAAIREADAAIAALGPIPALDQAALALELRAGRTDAALERIDRMLRRAGRNESLLLQRAGILERAGREKAAKAAYAETLATIEARAAARRGTPDGRAIEAEARDAIARLAQGDPG